MVGLGGLGHMAVKLAASMGAEVTVLSHLGRQGGRRARGWAPTPSRRPRDEATFKKLAGHFDLIIDTISAPHDYNAYLGLLRARGTMVLRRRAAGADAGLRVLADLAATSGWPAR